MQSLPPKVTTHPLSGMITIVWARPGDPSRSTRLRVKTSGLHPEAIRHSHSAAALIIVLSFIVLLAGLIIAFFSRAVLDRQISNSSASLAKTEIFAQGATDQIIGDLRQEIIAGSSPTPSGMTLYVPKVPATAVPALVGSTGTGGLENLVKRSAYTLPFYPATNYDLNNINRAAGPSTQSSTTVASLNNRFISLARWNKPLLLRKADETSDTNFTPVAAYVAPDWVLVARNGTNPTAWNTNLIASGSNNTGAVTGRYAYNIYDEGGLLDMNVAGYPSPSTPAQKAYKPALAYADLTQLKDSLGNQLITSAQIDSIVGWRNYTSASIDWTQNPPALSSPALSGAFPLATTAWTTPLTANYYNYTLQQTKGFLTAVNPVLNSGQSDHLFTSRQQLIKMLTGNLVGPSGTAATRAPLQNALQYLTHFSRDLNQPSFAPLPASITPDATHRSAIIAQAAGGNDAVGGDDIINPSFLKVRVASSFTRFDGSTAKAGEPLVKKRFSLNRLAWITFKGPIADDSGNLSSDTDVKTSITALKAAGFTDAFLKQGGPANIYKYFGLSWVTDPKDPTQNLWCYSHQGNAPLASAITAGSNPPAANIKTLSGGTNPISGREADFVELLRAGIAAGSVGKGFYNGGGIGGPDDYAYKKDVKSAEQIIQIVANIIDQFDGDSYPTRILYDDGTLPAITPVPQEYRGVEDLPYFYRWRGSMMKVKESTPAFTGKTQSPPAGTVATGNEGMGVAFQQPEIWNPHTWNPSATPSSLRPTSFRLTAVGAPPSLTSPATPDPNVLVVVPGNRYDNSIVDWNGCPPSNAPIKSISLSQDSTALLFDIPNNRPDLFREPTLLIKPDVPAGSNLRCGPNNLILTDSVLAPYLSSGSGTNRGITNIATSPFYVNNGATDNRLYIGIYMGAFPLIWTTNIGGIDRICNAFIAGNTNGIPFTYRVQYETSPGSNRWITYDEKFAEVIMGTTANRPNVSGSRPNFIDPVYTIGNDNGRCFSDPRTTRWHVPTCAWAYNTSRQAFEWTPSYSSYGTDFSATQKSGAAASTTAYTAGNANLYAASQNALWSIRPDAFSGYVTYPPSSSLGWYQAPMGSANNSQHFRPGMISQNNPSAKSGGWCANQGVVGQGSSGTQIFFADADNVVRRGMAAYLPPTATDPGDPRSPQTPAGATSGEPQQVATQYSASGVATPDAVQSLSRPIMLNRPFRTVAELGYVFSDTPWRNLDFSTPESAFSALLDVFCINNTDDANSLAAGKVNLNTRQAPVLQAILAGAYKDEFTPATSLSATGNGSANAIATALVTRTSDVAATYGPGSGPLANISELVGKWVGPVVAIGASSDGGKSYSGFSGVETTPVAPSAPSSSTPLVAPNLSYVLSQDTSVAGYSTKVVQRYREATMRALASTGQTRVWNLMIDLVAQTGRYPQSASSLDKFAVEGEQRYWVHLAIDRYTGQVIDKQIEIVKE